MSLLRRVDITELDPFCPAFPLLRETSLFAPRGLSIPSFFEDPLDVCFALDHLSPQAEAFEFFDTLTDLIPTEKPSPAWSYRRIHRRVGVDSYLEALCDRVDVVESRFDRLVSARRRIGDRKYSWTAELEGRHADTKCKWTAAIKQGKEGKNHHHRPLKVGKSYKWTAEIKEKGEEGPIKRTYTWKSSIGNGADSSRPLKGKKEKKDKKEKKGACTTRLVEIEELNDHGAVALRKAFANRTGVAERAKGKKKELSPQHAASLIQMSFRAYLIRRSQALRALRDLAVAKTKLKEVRALFNNFSYRRRVTRDTEERQRFAEKIIVVLLSVDAIEGIDLMVRSAKKSMVDELEAMLDVVDPQPLGKSLSIRRRRTFDVPDGLVEKEIADGVAQIVRMLDQEEKSSTSTSEV